MALVRGYCSNHQATSSHKGSCCHSSGFNAVNSIGYAERITFLDWGSSLFPACSWYYHNTAAGNEIGSIYSIYLWRCEMYVIGAVVHSRQNIITAFKHLWNVLFTTSSVFISVTLYYFPSVFFISIFILLLTNPSTSHSVNISWCPSNAPHSHGVEIVSSLRYSVSVCVCVMTCFSDLLWIGRIYMLIDLHLCFLRAYMPVCMCFHEFMNALASQPVSQ